MKFLRNRNEIRWSVSVERDGINILNMSPNEIGGVDLTEEDEEVIRLAATHLLAFVGERKT